MCVMLHPITWSDPHRRNMVEVGLTGVLIFKLTPLFHPIQPQYTVPSHPIINFRAQREA